MPDKPIIPRNAPGDICTFTILSNGIKVAETFQFLSITVNKEINRIPLLTMVIAESESFSVSNDSTFQPGKEFEVRAGYHGNEETIFKGIVIKHGIKIAQGGSMVIIECFDNAVKMSVSPKNRYFKDLKDSEIIRELVDKYGIETEIGQTYVHHRQVIQYNCTDWDFLLFRAEINGLFCFMDNGKLIIERPDFSAETTLTIQYGAVIHELEAEIDARLQFKAVKAVNWNAANGYVILNGELEETKISDAGNISSADLSNVIGEESLLLWYNGAFKEEELQQRANAIMLKHKLAKITGKVIIDGSAAVKPGQFIQLDGIGERFEGKLFVTGVKHNISGGKWQTIIHFGLKLEWFINSSQLQQPIGNAVSPVIQGLHIGVVSGLEGDPEGEYRIMVRLTNIHTEEEGVWTRVCTQNAGKVSGTFFRPVIGDEVIVGFINNDPQFGVMLGVVNSSYKPA